MNGQKQRDNDPTIQWDSGTAYDFFISYSVLAKPKHFGLRTSWATGMRARLQPEVRDTLDQALHIVDAPDRWLHSLDGPKSTRDCLDALARIPAEERLARLTCCPRKESERSESQRFLLEVSRHGKWREQDLDELRVLRTVKKKTKTVVPGDEELRTLLDAWANASEFGKTYLQALRSYFDVFFEEEERRISPKLEAALERAQERAQVLPFMDFIEEISQGIRYEASQEVDTVTLVPSFWISPFVRFHALGEREQLWTFGARSAQDSLVPGAPVPDALRVALKALADPTRLRILRYLNKEPLTMAELTKRLRLRMPTVMHHIAALRLAGLVSIHVEAREKGHRQRFGTRMENLETITRSLREFLEEE